MKYQSKAVIIEADEIVSWSREPGDNKPYNFALRNGESVEVPAMQCGNHEPKDGDFFIRREDGDNYLCPRNVFEEKYMPLPAIDTQAE